MHVWLTQVFSTFYMRAHRTPSCCLRQFLPVEIASDTRASNTCIFNALLARELDARVQLSSILKEPTLIVQIFEQSSLLARRQPSRKIGDH
jgi:hypothetical protein